MNIIAVFCGASLGENKIYKEQVYKLGIELAQESITLVYGGSKTGLMGEIANGVLNNNGKVVGIIPNFLVQRELVHTGLTEIIYVETMHERKAKMNELSDGFIILPGGAGTMEEFFEMFTWAQLGLHQKPIIIFNIDNFFTPLIALIDQMIVKGFIDKNSKDLFEICTSQEKIIIELNKSQQFSLAVKIDSAK